jgi:hypothetical protein
MTITIDNDYKRLTEYDKSKIATELQNHRWSHAITIHAREPTWGSLWLSITEAFDRLRIDGAELKYWVIGARGYVTDKPHYHGIIYYERIARRQFNRCFRGVNSPSLVPLYELGNGTDGWLGYVLKQALTDTTITNLEGDY